MLPPLILLSARAKPHNFLSPPPPPYSSPPGQPHLPTTRRTTNSYGFYHQERNLPYLPLTLLQTTMSNSELAVSYAALILADDCVEVTVRIPSSGKFLTWIRRKEGRKRELDIDSSVFGAIGRQAPSYY